MKRGPKVGKSAFDGVSNVDNVPQPWNDGSAGFQILVGVGFSGVSVHAKGCEEVRDLRVELTMFHPD